MNLISEEFQNKIIAYSEMDKDPFANIKEILEIEIEDEGEEIIYYSIKYNVYKAIKNFLERLSSKDKLEKKTRWQIMCELTFYSSLDLIKYWYESNEDYNLEELNINIQYSWDCIDASQSKKYFKNNFIRNLIFNNKYSSLLYFCYKYKVNFWTLFVNNLNIDYCHYKCYDYSSFFSNKSNNKYFLDSIFKIKIDNSIILKYEFDIFHKFINNNVQEERLFDLIMIHNDNNIITETYLTGCLIYKKYHILKRIFRDFKRKIDHIQSWDPFMNTLFGEGYYNMSDDYIKTSNNIIGICCLIIKYLKDKNEDIGYLFNEDIITKLVVLHNPIKVLKYLNKHITSEQFNNLDNSGFTPIIDCARYGSFQTFLYLYKKTKNRYVVTDECLELNILSASCYNNDIRIMKFILENYDDKLNLPKYIKMCLKGLNNSYGKRNIVFEKIKLIDKYYNLNNKLLLILNFISSDKIQQQIIDYFKEKLLEGTKVYKITDNNQTDLEYHQTSYNGLNYSFYDNYENVKYLLKYVSHIYSEGVEKTQFIYYVFENIIKCKFNKKWLHLINKYISYDNISLGNIIYYNYDQANILDKIEYIKKKCSKKRFNEIRLQLLTQMNSYIPNNKIYIYFLIGAPLEKLQKNQFNEYINKLYKCRLILKKYIRLKFKKIESFHKDQLIKSIHEITYSPMLNETNIKSKINTIVNPEHIKIEHILDDNFLYNKKLIISEKADGLTKILNIMRNDLFPPLKKNRNSLRGEYIESLNVYMVFDIDNNTSLREKYNYLMNNHSYVDYNNFFINSIKDLYNYKKHILPQFNDFCKIAKQNKYKKYWWPKPVWNIKLEGEELIDFLENITDLELCIFPTDGWIITNIDKTFSYKLKPKKHLTIDLLYKNNKWYDSDINEYNIRYMSAKNNCIYRCYYNGDWEARESREEKKTPNNRSIVENVIKYQKYDFRIKSLKEFINIPYYKNFNFNENKTQNNISKILSNIINKKRNILDLGCGYNYFYNKNIIDLYDYYMGIDMDYNIYKKIIMLKSKFLDFKFLDFRKDWSTIDIFNNKNINKKFDIVLIINSIHYALDDNGVLSANFFKQINEYTNKNAKIFISFCDKDKLLNITKKYKNITDGASYVKIINNNTIKYYYSWAHDKPQIDKLLDYDLLIKEMEAINFKIKLDTFFTSNRKTNSIIWKRYLDCFRLVEFIKL